MTVIFLRVKDIQGNKVAEFSHGFTSRKFVLNREALLERIKIVNKYGRNDDDEQTALKALNKAEGSK